MNTTNTKSPPLVKPVPLFTLFGLKSLAES